ncbi:MAG: SdiA-regulated domain-containing protein [Luteolibacter sp.]
MNPKHLPSPRVSLAMTLTFACWTGHLEAASFTSGNLAILQAAASTSNTTCSVVEVSPTSSTPSTPVQTIAIDGTTLPGSLRFSGSATSTGYLANSQDRTLLAFTGHNSTTSGTTNANTLTARGVGVFNNAGTFSLAATYTGSSGNQTRCATTLDNSTWFIADQGGLYTNSTTTGSPSGNFRGVKNFGGSVYLGQASGTAATIQVATISAPTGATATGLSGLTNNAALQDFFLISSGDNGSAFDVLYVLSGTSNTAGTIAKYSLFGGSWVSNGTYTTTFGGFGLAASDNANGATLYVTTGLGALTANSLLKITDTSGFNSTISITTANNATLYTAPTGAIIKGVAFAPVASGPTSVDLSKYVRVGRYDLPEPTRTTPPANSLLAQEASGVTYNWDADTLFIVGDGGTSVTEVTKTGQLVSSMTLPPGTSAQSTEFFDTEGITYIGGGQFVMTEERDRQAVKFTYVAGGTLTRAAAQTVKVGTTVGNIGLEGLTYDPQTGGFIFAKEMEPEGIFQTTIDFTAGTASNGSPSTVNSTNLFDPALASLEDMSDVFAFSNLPSMTGQPQAGNLLILSQESGMIRNVDRSGNIFSTLTLVADAGNPLSIQNQTQEGITMDRAGNIYVVSENGGGDQEHPQLWVFAPSNVTDVAPTALALSAASTTIPETTSTTLPVKMANIMVADADGVGVNTLSVSGPDAASFQIIGSGLYLKAGTALSFATKPSYSVTVNVDDTTVGATPDASGNFTLNLTAVSGGSGTIRVTEVAPWSSGDSAVGADWFELTNTGSTAVNISGWTMTDSNVLGFSSAGALNGSITSIAAGESVIFVDGQAKIEDFKTNWFGSNVPFGLRIGYYGGPGLSTSGDAVTIYDGVGNLKARVDFGASPSAAPRGTFDNAAGLDSAIISQISVPGQNGAFTAAATTNEIGSPGTAAVSSIPLVSIVATDAGASETGPDSGTFRISRTGSTTSAMTVVYSIASGSGQATSADYTPALASPATIPAGESFVDITITPVDDSEVEGGETVTLNLGDTGSYDVGTPASATVTIIDNDVANLPPTAVALNNKVSLIVESASTVSPIKVADITVTDDGQGTNAISLSGTDAAFFEITGGSLYLKAGTTLSYATKPAYNVTVSVDDVSVGTTPDVSVNFTLTIAQAVPAGSIVITEVAPWSNSNSGTLAVDWFEVTNIGTNPINTTGWRMDDSSPAFATSVALGGVTSIAPGESVIFMETADLAGKSATFRSLWFGGNPPANRQIGNYTGTGVGLSSSGDAVNLFDAGGNVITGIVFGASPTGPFATFDNKAGLGSTTLPGPTISTLSAVGVNGAFAAKNDSTEIGSPGTTVTPTFLGVSAGDADSTSATLWTRSNEGVAYNITAQVATDPAFTTPVSFSAVIDATKDHTAKVSATGLASGTKFFYRFVVNGSGETSGVGTFKTAPAANASAPLHFAFSGDNDGLMRPYALASVIPSQNLDFYVNLGDVIYENASNVAGNNAATWLNSPSVTLSNSALNLNGVPVGGTTFATQAQLKADYAKKYRENFLPVNAGGQNSLQTLYAGQGNYTTWDNHELGNRKYIDGGSPAGGSVGGATGTDMPSGRGVDARDNGAGNPANINDVNTSATDIMNRSTGFQTLRDVFLSYQPMADRGTISAPTDPRTDGSKRLYSAQQWGKNATYINTDARSYRDIRLKTANAGADDTGPRADNPNRTYLGATQLAWLEQSLLDAQSNGTTWKFVSISDPIDQLGPIGGALTGTLTSVSADGGKAFMGGYRAERNALLKFIVDNHIANVVFLSTDDHQNRINELSYSPTGQTGTQSSYVKVPFCFSIVCGPLGATGPDTITDHTFVNIKNIADSLANAQTGVNVDPIGLENYPGLHSLYREGDATAGSSPQPVDFYSPDTFNFTTLDVSADGKTLSVSSIGMNSTTQNSGTEYANGPQARTVFSFQIDAPTELQTWRAAKFGTTSIAGNLANDADYDNDGGQNLVEYALGIDPTTGAGVNGPSALPVPLNNDADALLTDRLALSFALPNPAPSDVTYRVQASDDLGTWTNVASKTGNGPWTWLGGGESHIVTTGSSPVSVKVGDVVPSSGYPERMMRLKMNNP